MRLVHFAPFAPHQCGLYETTRDIIKAERMLGHDVELVDVGVAGKRRVGAVDDRAGCLIRTAAYEAANTADLIIAHGDMPRTVLEATSAPLVQIMHGRPEASFRLEQREPQVGPVYSIYKRNARQERWARFITLWPEFLPYWESVIPRAKLAATRYPPCDLELYTPDGPRHVFEPSGEINILVADVWRQDMDPFHILFGIVAFARRRKGVRVHVYGCTQQLGPWQHLIAYLQREGICGEIKGMMLNLDRVMRAADLVVTPHKIATRIIRESLACGTPVVAGRGCLHTRYTAQPDDPEDVARAIAGALAATQLTGPAGIDPRGSAQAFDLHGTGHALDTIYRTVLEQAQAPIAVGA